MLDVDYSEASGIVPVSKTSVDYYMEPEKDSLEYIPVIYIANAVLKNMAAADRKTYARIFLQNALRIETFIPKKVMEIQIDCDWTAQTREAYFELLHHMKYWLPKHTFSVTLRLYPYKYRKELGIPPVHRAMLMLYNTGKATDLKEKNSLFNPNTVGTYLRRKDYPLPLDFAVPAFSWSLVYRGGKLIKAFTNNIVAEMNAEQQRYPEYTDTIAINQLSPHTWLVTQRPAGFNNYGLQAGDVLKVESCGVNELKQAVWFIRQFPYDPKATISIFDLDMVELSKIPFHEIETVFTHAG